MGRWLSSKAVSLQRLGDGQLNPLALLRERLPVMLFVATPSCGRQMIASFQPRRFNSQVVVRRSGFSSPYTYAGGPRELEERRRIGDHAIDAVL